MFRNLLIVLIIVAIFVYGNDIPVIKEIRAALISGIEHLGQYVNLNEIKKAFNEVIGYFSKLLNRKG